MPRNPERKSSITQGIHEQNEHNPDRKRHRFERLIRRTPHPEPGEPSIDYVRDWTPDKAIRILLSFSSHWTPERPETWDGWLLFVGSHLAEPYIRDTKSGPLWYPVTFGNSPDENGNYAHDANVTSITALVLDITNPDPAQQIQYRLTRLNSERGTMFWAHTLWTSTEENPRWRVWLPLARPIHPSRIEEAYAYADRRFGFKRRPGIRPLSHGYRMPAHRPGNHYDFDWSGHNDATWFGGGHPITIPTPKPDKPVSRRRSGSEWSKTAP